MVAACSKFHPRDRYHVAWRALEVWRQRRPTQQAPAAPVDLAYDAVAVLAVQGSSCVSTVCSAPRGRCGCCGGISWTPLGWTAFLSRTDRSLEQKVMFSSPPIVGWLGEYDRRAPRRADDAAVTPISYRVLQRRLQAAALLLGFPLDNALVPERCGHCYVAGTSPARRHDARLVALRKVGAGVLAQRRRGVTASSPPHLAGFVASRLGSPSDGAQRLGSGGPAGRFEGRAWGQRKDSK